MLGDGRTGRDSTAGARPARQEFLHHRVDQLRSPDDRHVIGPGQDAELRGAEQPVQPDRVLGTHHVAIAEEDQGGARISFSCSGDHPSNVAMRLTDLAKNEGSASGWGAAAR